MFLNPSRSGSLWIWNSSSPVQPYIFPIFEGFRIAVNWTASMQNTSAKLLRSFDKYQNSSIISWVILQIQRQTNMPTNQGNNITLAIDSAQWCYQVSVDRAAAPIDQNTGLVVATCLHEAICLRHGGKFSSKSLTCGPFLYENWQSFSFRGLCSHPHQGLFPWTPIGALPPDSRYKLMFLALAMVPPLSQILDLPLIQLISKQTAVDAVG